MVKSMRGVEPNAANGLSDDIYQKAQTTQHQSEPPNDLAFVPKDSNLLPEETKGGEELKVSFNLQTQEIKPANKKSESRDLKRNFRRVVVKKKWKAPEGVFF